MFLTTKGFWITVAAIALGVIIGNVLFDLVKK